jgi:2-dehydro-3-deoxygluconokinase
LIPPAERPIKIALFGECMIELSQQSPGLWKNGFAGDSFNTAIYLNRLADPMGIEVQYACGLGGDLFTPRLIEFCKTEQLKLDLSRSISNRSLGLYAISVDTLGERSFSYWRETSAARDYFSADITPLEAFASEIDVLYLTGISLAIVPSTQINRLWGLLNNLKSMGKKIVFDNNYRPKLWSSVQEAQEQMGRCIQLADIALLTLDDELAMHPQEKAEDAIGRCFDVHQTEVIIKQGADPVLIKSSSGQFSSVKVDRVQPIDTTGAGDSFAAAYLYSRLRGLSPTQSAIAGNQLASKVILHSGAIIPIEQMNTEN